MSFVRSRKKNNICPSSMALVILVVLVLQLWVCYECGSCCKAGAIRLLQEDSERNGSRTTGKVVMSKEEHFRQYFHERARGLNLTQEGFDESKRRVPSCPDPLHN
ncbi:hypothetical protein Tsubulata_031377 [Turnera subulata]|uniref:CLAVATA3/ESR (CLE)-related protein 27 n=1 Tax=Turnera subulata TaxID=218843 RepID=A0A9Q0JN71_9ROSI|nr:hypothetical protein Tsubulata_031377 [Turnera subulata]